MRVPSALPIDGHLVSIAEAAYRSGAVVVAPPGTGKSTRVPSALVERTERLVVVLQPRRLAARMLAARVAEERGSALGDEIGYEVRHDRKRSARTRVVYMTAGLFARRILADPELSSVGCVVIDEFHERQIEADLALALCRHLRTRRRDLGLVVMSATLDPQPVAAFLDGAVGAAVRKPPGFSQRRRDLDWWTSIRAICDSSCTIRPKKPNTDSKSD